MGKLKEEWQAAIKYIRNPYEPSLEEIEASNIVQKVNRLFQVLLLDLVCMLPLVGLLSLIEQLGLVDMEDHALRDALEQYPIWVIAFLVITIGPLAEEVIFRLHLSRRWNLIAGLMEIFSASSNKITRQEAAGPIKVKWDRFYGLFFYLNAAAFALIHISNFEANSIPVWVTPLIVLPQFIAGLYFGYIRVKNGNLFWSVALHALHNAILLAPVLLFELPTN